jgi:hypothetical protein
VVPTGCQPQYPDLQGDFNIDFARLQGVFGTTRHLPALTRHRHPTYSVIEEIVEGFVEGFLTSRDIRGSVQLPMKKFIELLRYARWMALLLGPSAPKSNKP